MNNNIKTIKNSYDFEQFSELLQNNNKYELLINWINESINTQKEYKINILVGCKNTRENDYDRFEDNNFYSFYIDIDLEEDKFDLEKEYNMFTLDYNNIDERFPKSSISNIHFDTGTSNFASIEYLDFAEKVLKKGGKMIYDLIDHGGVVFKYNKINKTLSNHIGTINKIEIEENMKIKIDFENKTIIPNVELGYYKDCNLSPQMNLTIFYNNYKSRFKKYPEQEYIGYITNKYTSLNFKEKSCNYINYLYPVKMRVINEEQMHVNLFNGVINFLINEIMNYDERLLYLQTCGIDYDFIMCLCERITKNEKYSLEIIGYIPNEILNICGNNGNHNLELILEEYLINVFSENIRYVECIKN